MPAEKIENIYQQGKINHFVGRIILNLSRQDRNVLHKNYKTFIFKPPSKTHDPEITYNVNKALDEVANEHSAGYYYANLLTQYAEVKSVRELSKKTGIPVMSIHQGIQRARIKIKQLLKKQQDNED